MPVEVLACADANDIVSETKVSAWHCQVVGVQQFQAQQTLTACCRSGSQGLFGDLIPHPESGGEFGAVIGGSHPMSGRAEVRGDTAERDEKPWAEPTVRNPFMARSRCGSVDESGPAPIIQILVLTVRSRRHRRPVRHPIRRELVGDQHPRPTALILQNFPKEPSRSLTVPSRFPWMRMSSMLPC